jgi:phosphoribosylformylglycinamidine synthase
MNFGSPERPEILWQFAEAIEGISEACRALEVPVVGGNVSFYNETLGEAILPTPVIGVVGVLDDATRTATQWFKAAGERIALLGSDAVSLGGSEYLWQRHAKVAGPLAPLDLALERRVQEAVRKAVAAGLVSASHDCSEGGIAVALAEAAVTGPARLGCEVVVEDEERADAVLFGEGPSRVMVTVTPAHEGVFETVMAECGIPWRWIGRTGGERLVIRSGRKVLVDVGVDRLEHAWRSGFERHMA